MDRMAKATELIGDELATQGGAMYRTCAAKVADGIRAAEAGVASTLASVPADRRVLVTDHDAFGYLAAAHGYRIAGAIIPSGTTLAAPSSGDLADLAKVIAANKVDAIFANSNSPQVLADAVANEVGYPVTVVDLYVDSLGAPGSGADTYIGYMQTDASRIAQALAG
jgi:zinc/manganese transport system substrate-binding protein